jgi:hypothetical protein
LYLSPTNAEKKILLEKRTIEKIKWRADKPDIITGS